MSFTIVHYYVISYFAYYGGPLTAMAAIILAPLLW